MNKYAAAAFIAVQPSPSPPSPPSPPNTTSYSELLCSSPMPDTRNHFYYDQPCYYTSYISYSQPPLTPPPQQLLIIKQQDLSTPKPAKGRTRGRRVPSNNHNIDIRTFACKNDNCGKVFKRSEHLKRHVQSIHTMERPFKCPYTSCNKTFSRSDNLSQHIRIHRHCSKSSSTTTCATTDTIDHHSLYPF